MTARFVVAFQSERKALELGKPSLDLESQAGAYVEPSPLWVNVLGARCSALHSTEEKAKHKPLDLQW